MTAKKTTKKKTAKKRPLPPMPTELALGLEVEDIVTGFRGIAAAKYEFLNSCVRYNVEKRITKEGKSQDQTIDSQRLKVVGWGVVTPPAKHEPSGTGGDGPEPHSRNEP